MRCVLCQELEVKFLKEVNSGVEIKESRLRCLEILEIS